MSDLFDGTFDEPIPEPFATGRALAIQGAARAMSTANRQSGGEFGSLAVAAFIDYAKRQGMRGFLLVEARHDAEESGAVPIVAEARAWGSIPAKARRLGYVRHLRYAQTIDAGAHAGPRSLWQWTGQS